MNVGYFEAQHDFYAILGVREGATTADIRKAHKRLVWELHPDRVRGRERDHGRIKLINLAATVLLNGAARARYDELRVAAKSGRLRPSTSAGASWRTTQPAHASQAATARASAYRARRRVVVQGSTLSDEFFRRLVASAVLATALVACITEHQRPSEALARAAARRRAEAVVFAPDYPPYPVRYAAAAMAGNGVTLTP